ncbi:MAG: DUF2887 domain-containing protein [Candidatus Kapaibacterium sp.]|nr:MAG: DUF2887 domain-containing protein [Candidatus Kapabacteria bacterium]
MKTDALYLNLFATAPILALRLAGLRGERASEYICASEELKKAFRVDALFTPPSPELPLIVAEVQFQRNPEIYDRLVASFAIKRLQSPMYTDIRMVIYFASRSIDTGATVYEPLVRSGLLNVVYLDEATEALERDDFTAEELSCLLLARLTVTPTNQKDDTEIVNELADTVVSMRGTAKQKEFLELFVDLFHSKYKHLQKEEIRAMLDARTILDIFDDIGESLAVQQYAKEYAKEYARDSIVQAVQNTEKITTLENARAMLFHGSQPEFVAKVLKLPPEVVEELTRNLNS